MVIMKHITSVNLIVVLSVILVSGCAGTVKNMRPVPADEVVTAPEEGKAMVVFMRPSTLGFGIQSSVFEVKDGVHSLVGIVAAKKKVAYQVEPGSHLFMIVGESADFMSTNLEPDRVYYALVAPRMGAWKARFSLRPVRSEELNSSEFNNWSDGCDWVEKSAESDSWAGSNMDNINKKYEKYYPKWLEKDSAKRPRLNQSDGK